MITLRAFRAAALSATIAGAILLAVAATPAGAKPLTWSLTSVQPVPEYGVPSEISGESCPGTNLCVAVTESGDILTSTDPSGGVSAWNESDVDGDIGIDAVSCPSTTLCVADDARGNILTSTDPGTSGVGSWAIAPVGWTGVSISCESTTLCLAGDENGEHLRIRRARGRRVCMGRCARRQPARHLSVVSAEHPLRRRRRQRQRPRVRATRVNSPGIWSTSTPSTRSPR